MNKDIIQKIAVVAIAIVLLYAAFHFIFKTENDPVAGAAEQNVEFPEVDLLTTRLNDLATINIDDTIFKNEVFKSLKNFDEDIYEYKQGRENPFEALDSDVEYGKREVRQGGEVIIIGLPSG